MTTLLRILISHAYDEKELAEAWKKLLETTSSHAIEVWFSSDLQATGGVPPGEDWRRDLDHRLAESNFVLAIQTPSSASRSWIMWECGIAHGIYSTQTATPRSHPPAAPPDRQEHGVIPIVYAMGRGDLANPLTTYQIYEGEDPDQVRQVCEYLLREAGLQPEAFVFKGPLVAYFRKIQAFHPRKMITAQEMQMWRERFEQLIRVGRTHEIVALRQMMYASFPLPFKPIDLILHDLLSDVLLKQQKYSEARQEVEYALKLASSDIHLLHRQVLILAEQRDFASAEAALQRILLSHPELRLNLELGSLYGRLQRQFWELTGVAGRLDEAIQAYLDVYEADKGQYFPGINAAELLLSRGEAQHAEEILQELLATCQRLQDQQEASYWLDFTLGEIHFGLGNNDLALTMYQIGLTRTPPPQPRERESALNGALRMIDQKKLPTEIKARVRRLFSLESI
jgi:tetratricopeptide (TPR) repeat protein